MFHSFGLTVSTLFPLFEGSRLFLYPSPLHYRIIAELVYELGATIMFGTDTFFRGYGKIAHPYDFHNIRFMYGGAEAVKLDTRNMWMERMGIRMMEAYGSTECSPVVTGNNSVFNRFGSIGKLLPAIEHKIEQVPGIEKGGELWVKGPNVMLGYYMPENPGVLVPPEGGWYKTGDVVEIDEIGFVYIRDRIKRFAKIAGEMVSLLAVEMIINKHFSGFINAIISIDDKKKGEQLVLITNCKNITKNKLLEIFDGKEITKLAIPKEILFMNEPPLLSTGKFDYVKAKDLVIDKFIK
jgi:acyl-[acyl-carrier-protein]-phospholipid O-acyltransferase/long-chain-fatty-acid--[acyl-carrier-protein] ligase